MKLIPIEKFVKILQLKKKKIRIRNLERLCSIGQNL